MGFRVWGICASRKCDSQQEDIVLPSMGTVVSSAKHYSSGLNFLPSGSGGLEVLQYPSGTRLQALTRNKGLGPEVECV